MSDLNPRQWRGIDPTPGDFSASYGASFMQLLAKTINRVMSDHELRGYKGNKFRPYLRAMADYCTLQGGVDHDKASFDHFRSVLTCVTPPQCPFTFLSRSGQGEIKVRVKIRSVT